MTRGVLSYAAQRLLIIAGSALLVSSIVFIGLHQLPADAFVREKCNPSCHRAQLHHYGLDQPWPVQYERWLLGALHGDLGESLINRGVEITPLLLREARTSATLGILAVLLATASGVLLGVVSAVRHDTWVDQVLSSGTMLGWSIPSFVVATVLVLITVSGFYWWTGGLFYENIGWGKLEQVPVPVISLALHPTAVIARYTRVSMLEVTRLDYIRTAFAKGLEAKLVWGRHALRNALIPVVTVLGSLTTQVITGSVVIENIFGIPGLGKEFVASILDRDYNVTIGVFTAYAMLAGLANLVVDLIYPLLDPKIRY